MGSNNIVCSTQTYISSASVFFQRPSSSSCWLLYSRQPYQTAGFHCYARCVDGCITRQLGKSHAVFTVLWISSTEIQGLSMTKMPSMSIATTGQHQLALGRAWPPAWSAQPSHPQHWPLQHHSSTTYIWTTSFSAARPLPSWARQSELLIPKAKLPQAWGESGQW